MPERLHGKQGKVWALVLTLKQRAVPTLEPCKGQTPRYWPAWSERSLKPNKASTWAMAMAARTAAKSMAGRAGSAGVCPGSCRVCRAEDDGAEHDFLAKRRDAGKVHAVLDDGDDKSADERAEHLA
ncbi:MAG: hypothetical protein ACYC3I_11260, partial [Gemmataceae bacterium]